MDGALETVARGGGKGLEEGAQFALEEAGGGGRDELGEQAAEENNYATSRRYLEEALALFNVEKVPRDLAEKQSWIFFKLGEVDYGEAMYESALSRFRKAVELANRLKDVGLLSRAQEAVWQCEEKLGIRKS